MRVTGRASAGRFGQAQGEDVGALAVLTFAGETAAVERPETRYAKSGDVSIAYQVVGESPVDLVLVPGFMSNVELAWEEPGVASFYQRLASFCRLIVFDKRGTGLSDRVARVATLETRMDDARAVMDAVGSERAALIGYSEGASLAALFETTYPERNAGLIMYGSYFAWDWMAEGRFPTRHESVRSPNYCDELLENDAPSKLDDEEFRRWYATRLRLSASPAAAVALQRMNVETDTRALLPSIRVPTLILHRVGDRNVDVKNARYAAEHIPGAKYVELAGDDHLPSVGDSQRIVDEIHSFLTGVWQSADAVKDIGIEIRAGLHTGECELVDGKTAGIAVHIGARVAALAGADDVLVSRTLKDLVAGSEIEFEDRGTHELKGVPGEWQLFSVKR